MTIEPSIGTVATVSFLGAFQRHEASQKRQGSLDPFHGGLFLAVARYLNACKIPIRLYSTYLFGHLYGKRADPFRSLLAPKDDSSCIQGMISCLTPHDPKTRTMPKIRRSRRDIGHITNRPNTLYVLAENDCALIFGLQRY